MSAQSISSRAGQSDSWRAVGLRAFEAGVAAVRPDKLVMEAVAVTGSGEAKHLWVLGESIPIPGGVSLIAFGKASILMARAAERQLGPALSRGVVIAQPSAESCPERCCDLKSEGEFCENMIHVF